MDIFRLSFEEFSAYAIGIGIGVWVGSWSAAIAGLMILAGICLAVRIFDARKES